MRFRFVSNGFRRNSGLRIPVYYFLFTKQLKLVKIQCSRFWATLYVSETHNQTFQVRLAFTGNGISTDEWEVSRFWPQYENRRLALPLSAQKYWIVRKYNPGHPTWFHLIMGYIMGWNKKVTLKVAIATFNRLRKSTILGKLWVFYMQYTLCMVWSLNLQAWRIYKPEVQYLTAFQCCDRVRIYIWK